MYHDRRYHMHLDRLGQCCINNHRGEGVLVGVGGRDEIVRDSPETIRTNSGTILKQNPHPQNNIRRRPRSINLGENEWISSTTIHIDAHNFNKKSESSTILTEHNPRVQNHHPGSGWVARHPTRRQRHSLQPDVGHRCHYGHLEDPPAYAFR